MNIFVQIGLMVVASIIQYALAPKPPTPKPASIDDVDAPVAEEGKPIPVVFGTVTLRAPNVLWFGDFRSVAIKKKGGKGK